MVPFHTPPHFCEERQNFEMKIDSYIIELNSIIEFKFKLGTSYINVDDQVIPNDILELVGSKNVVGIIDLELSRLKMGMNDLKEIWKSMFPDSELPENLRLLPNIRQESEYNFFVSIEILLRRRMLDMIREVVDTRTDRDAIEVLNAIEKFLRRYKTVILEDDSYYLRRSKPSLWGNDLNDEELEILSDYYSYFEPTRFSPKLDNELVFDLTLAAIRSATSDALSRIGKLVESLDPDSQVPLQVAHNGLFFSYGPKQRRLIENMLQNAGDELVPKEELSSWIEFLSGQTLPGKPLNWTGPLTHFSFLLRKSSVLSDDPKRVTKLPLSLVKSQVDWDAIGQYVLYKGKRVTHKMTTNSVDPEKNTRVKYILDFYELYQGE